MAASAEPARHDHLPAILALNHNHEAQTSPLTAASLSQLVATSFCTLVAGAGLSGFVIALDQHADYASPNYQWFKARFARFTYIDRIVVAPQAQRQGIAHSLYNAVFDAAIRAGHHRVTCEVNVHPVNPRSDAFHAALNFTELGRATLAGGKTVRYLARDISPSS